jgi:peptidyl-tRNA hydrolase
MNDSGRAVHKAYRRLGWNTTGQVLVIYDDLELPVGKVKLRTMGMGRYILPICFLFFYEGGELMDRGHNGIESCVRCFQSDVGPPCLLRFQ